MTRAPVGCTSTGWPAENSLKVQTCSPFSGVFVSMALGPIQMPTCVIRSALRLVSLSPIFGVVFINSFLHQVSQQKRQGKCYSGADQDVPQGSPDFPILRGQAELVEK